MSWIAGDQASAVTATKLSSLFFSLGSAMLDVLHVFWQGPHSIQPNYQWGVQTCQQMFLLRSLLVGEVTHD